MTYNKKDRKKIAELAYYKWQADGSPQGHDGKKYWLEAEQELTRADVRVEEIDLDLRYDIVRSLR
jgi:hypothetical protein